MSGKFWIFDVGNLFNAAPAECRAQRIHLDVGDTSDHHNILRVYLRASGDPFQVRVGYHTQLNSEVQWTPYKTFDPETDYKLDFRVCGRQHAIEFYSKADVSWRIDGVEIDYTPAGRR